MIQDSSKYFFEFSVHGFNTSLLSYSFILLCLFLLYFYSIFTLFLLYFSLFLVNRVEEVQRDIDARRGWDDIDLNSFLRTSCLGFSCSGLSCLGFFCLVLASFVLSWLVLAWLGFWDLLFFTFIYDMCSLLCDLSPFLSLLTLCFFFLLTFFLLISPRYIHSTISLLSFILPLFPFFYSTFLSLNPLHSCSRNCYFLITFFLSVLSLFYSS